MITLNADNYYDVQASREYMTCSQYSAFLECPTAAYHRFILGDVKKEDYKAFVDGNFAHSHFESKESHHAFIDSHPEIISSRGKTAGKMKVEYQNWYNSFKDAEKDESWMKYMRGQKEAIFTGELCGMQWAVKADVINDEEGFCSDFKFMKELDGEYWMGFDFDTDGNILPPGTKESFAYHKNILVPFYEKYIYWRRFAVYRHILHKATGKAYEMYMPCLSKEIPANRAVYAFNNAGRFLIELQEIQRNLPLIKEQRNGNDLTRCEKCTYCRASKKKVELQVASSLW